MLLKNISVKVISVGTTVILPDEVKEVSDKLFTNNSSVDALIEIGFLKVVEEEKKAEAEVPNNSNDCFRQETEDVLNEVPKKKGKKKSTKE